MTLEQVALEGWNENQTKGGGALSICFCLCAYLFIYLFIYLFTYLLSSKDWFAKEQVVKQEKSEIFFVLNLGS